MERTIKSIRRQETKYNVYVYIDYNNGTYGVRNFDKRTHKAVWTNNVTDADKAFVKEHSINKETKRFEDWCAPREMRCGGRDDVFGPEDTRSEIEEYNRFCTQHPGNRQAGDPIAGGVEW